MSGEDAAYPKAATGKPVALEARVESADGRRFSPSIERNKDAVVAVFEAEIAHDAFVLEIASGTGEHGFHICERLKQLSWTYSDIDGESRVSQASWRARATHDRLDGPLELNVTEPDWGRALNGRYDAIFCANMIHIAPFEAAVGLIRGAGELLSTGGRLMLYGPFSRNGDIAPSNMRFSEDLKRRDSRWGVRDLDLDILPLANAAGLDLHKVIEMPANNLSVTFQRRPN